MPTSEKRFVINGDRFEAYVSPNRLLTDLVDRELKGRLILLRKSSVVELRDLCQELIDVMGDE
jgi:hypothetical protein